MKLILSLFMLAGAVSLQAATYTTNFSGVTSDVAGYQGWTINDPQPSLSFGVTWNGSTAAALGGDFASPDVPVVGLNHTYGEALGTTTASFAFALVDSVDFAGRDTFGFSFKDGATNLFSVVFVPNDPTQVDPEGTTATWSMFYVTGAGTFPLSIAIEESTTQNFSLAFTPNGSSTNFSLNLSGLVRTGTFAVPSSTIASDFALEYTADQAGDNYIMVDNLSVVPEPSSFLLLGLAGLGFVSRRKRA